jgi:hypothetical protein
MLCLGRLPYVFAFSNEVDVTGGRVVRETLQKRLEMMARDVSIYGKLLAGQRRSDLAATEAGFLARYRK